MSGTARLIRGDTSASQYENSHNWWDYQTCSCHSAGPFMWLPRAEIMIIFLELTNPPPPLKAFILPPGAVWRLYIFYFDSDAAALAGGRGRASVYQGLFCSSKNFDLWTEQHARCCWCKWDVKDVAKNPFFMLSVSNMESISRWSGINPGVLVAFIIFFNSSVLKFLLLSTFSFSFDGASSG